MREATFSSKRGGWGDRAGSRAAAPFSARGLRTQGRAALLLLAVLLASHTALSSQQPREWAGQTSPGAPPSASRVTLASLGEPAGAGYALLLFVQSFDSQAGKLLPLRSLDAQAIGDWLDTALDLHPASGYPLLLAARVYAEGLNPADGRAMLERVHRRFLEAPDLRWPWLAHAIFVARHTLKDAALAKRFAQALREHATGPGVPSWARQAEIFLLEDLDELQAARVLLGGLIDSGRVTDPAELAFLGERLRALDGRIGTDGRPSTAAGGGR